MRRREFITLLGGAAAASVSGRSRRWRSRASGCGGSGAHRLAPDIRAQARLGAFLQGLQEFGWAIGRNVRIDYRWGAGNSEQTRRYAAELAALVPDVILTSGATAVAPLLQATRSVPIVFAQVPDPVGAGFVKAWRIRAAIRRAL